MFILLETYIEVCISKMIGYNVWYLLKNYLVRGREGEKEKRRGRGERR